MKAAYIHIPFCDSICSYCDFCKFLKNNEWINKYLDSLQREINNNYKGEILDTIYIGGGTPSCLNELELTKLFNIIKILKLNKEYEFTFECNIENITKDKLKLLYNNGVNRLSMGIQTFNEKYLNFLNRKHTKEQIIENIKLAKEIGFKNINIDLIYGLPNQTLEDLNSDIEEFLKLDITHISTYSLIIEPNTKLYIDNNKNIDDNLDYEMYKLICSKLKDSGYNHYEISNFSKVGHESKHNLTYWNNDNYYGFGIGASGYIDNIRYDNTRSFNKYISGEYIKETHILDINETIENEFILGLRKINGISKEIFKEKYNKDIKDIEVVNKLLDDNKLLEDEKNIYINPNYVYVSNDILVEFIN